jgi:hypothetical protein
MEPCRVCSPEVNDLHRFDEDPDPHLSEKSDPDPHCENIDPDPHWGDADPQPCQKL